MKTLFLLCAMWASVVPALAEVRTEEVLYRDGKVELEGFVAYDPAIKGTRPGILVVHDWTGLQEYAKSRTKQLAEMGYIAFAIDVYGKGIRPNDPKECAIQAGSYRRNLPLLRRRVLLGLEQLKAQPGVDPKRIGAIGYCFGGACVLELARSGEPVAGVVSFHGALATTMPPKAGQVKAAILVCHGEADPFVKPDEVAAFKEEMKKAGARMEFIGYPGVVHSFTRPDAGSDLASGKAYDAKADRDSWSAMQRFFKECFAKR